MLNSADLAPRHDPASFFRDIVEKFGSRSPQERLQGAWIITELKQEVDELHHAYSALDSSRLHFAILYNWSKEAYFLARDDVDTMNLAALFGLRHSPSTFTFQRKDKLG